MTVSELVWKLRKIQKHHGNLEVTVYDEEHDDITTIENDGIVILETEDKMYVVIEPTDQSILK